MEKIDGHRIELFKEEIEFSRLISDISHFGNLMAGQNKIKFHIGYVDDLPNFILADNARLSQILWNLISNAVKFTPAGGDIYLDVKALDKNRFSFTLTDTGIGIPKNEQDKIFTMFYQAENTQEKKAQGSGIGLAVSKHIARLMGGDLTLESEQGKGSSFVLTIQAEPVQERHTVKINDHSLKVLLVEDIEVNVVVARAMLEKFGCDVDVAMSGAEAFSWFERQSYDLILLDIQLPDMTGFEIAQKLRERYEKEEIDYLPLLVALTANIMQTKDDYRRQGMDDILRKPLSLESLAECLNYHFGSDFVENSAEIPPLAEEENEILPFDRKLLSELLEVMSVNAVLENFALFAKLMPRYLSVLNCYLASWQATKTAEMRKNVANEAHKIKGALASVGLKKLQDVAQSAQNDNGEIWEEQIAHRIAEIERHWQQDLAAAEEWVKTQACGR